MFVSGNRLTLPSRRIPRPARCSGGLLDVGQSLHRLEPVERMVCLRSECNKAEIWVTPMLVCRNRHRNRNRNRNRDRNRSRGLGNMRLRQRQRTVSGYLPLSPSAFPIGAPLGRLSSLDTQRASSMPSNRIWPERARKSAADFSPPAPGADGSRLSQAAANPARPAPGGWSGRTAAGRRGCGWRSGCRR